MKKFVFSLEKVLSFQRQKLDVKKQELSVLHGSLHELEQEIRNLEARFAGLNAEMRQAAQTGMNACDMAAYKIYSSPHRRQKGGHHSEQHRDFGAGKAAGQAARRLSEGRPQKAAARNRGVRGTPGRSGLMETAPFFEVKRVSRFYINLS